MFGFGRACVLVTPIVVLLVAAPAGAGRLGTSGSPSPESLVLTKADVPGTTVSFSGFVPGQAMPGYARVFVPKRRGGSMVDAVLILHPDAAHAAAIVEEMNTYAQTSRGRQAFAKASADGMRATLESAAARAKLGIVGKPSVSKVVVGLPSRPATDTTVLPYTIVLAGVTLRISIAYVQVDRAIDAIELISEKRAPSTSALARLIAKARARMKVGFSVANIAPPTINGTATIGQTLTLDSGDWTGGATDFAYTWQRCAADGSACVPIDGANGVTYVVSSADAGSTIRVTLTGANTVSRAQATSQQTVVVS